MPLAPGTRIGPYEVATPIGAGGMGEVYRAKDTTLGLEVAVKVLPAAFAQDQDRVTRLRREAQVLASVSHPNIASIHGLEETSGAVALALELVEGEDLQQRLRRGAIPVEEAMAIARQIAQGLEAAHERGIVHRDLKPANVKVTPEGEVKLLDFGLAGAYETGAASAGRTPDLSHSPTRSNTATETGLVLGTAAYMSPEQARGKTVDKRSDIWSFGVVMFEMLSGRRLFQGETASDTLAAVLRQEIDWRLLPSRLPPADRRLIERCLERDPRGRLRDIGEARITLSRRDRGGEPLARGTRRDVLRLAAAAAAGLAGGIGLMSLGPRPSGPARGDGLRITPLTSSGNVVSVSISPDGSLIAYVESDQGLESLWLQQVASGQTLRLLPERSVAYWSHVFTPDGNTVIFGEKSQSDPGGALYSISILGGAARRIVSGMDSPPAFSPDGKRMAYTRLAFPNADQTSLMVASIDGMDPKPLAVFNRPERVAGLFYGGPTWSPDGRSIVTAMSRPGREEQDARAWLISVSVADGAVRKIADPGWIVANQAAFLPDGSSLIVIARSVEQSDNQIWRVSLPGGEARRVTTDLNDHRIVSLTRDGKGLASVAGDVSSTVSAVPVKTSGRSRRLGRGRNDGLNGVGFGPGGQAIYTAFNGGRWSLWSADLDGGDRRMLYTADPAETLTAPSTTRSGTTYFFSRSLSGGRLRALDAGSGAARTVGPAIGAGNVSQDGRFIVYPNGPAGRLFRRDLPDGDERLLIDLPAILPAIDPEGRRVAFSYTTPEGAFRFGVCPAAGGPLLIDLPAEPISTTAGRIVIRGDALYVNTLQGDRANVWRVSLSGGPARQITPFTEQLLFDFALSDDFERDGLILVARGRRLRDAQLITGF